MKNYKSILYLAVIYSVITGVIYVTYAILGLLSRWCVIEMNGSPVVYMMFLLFFRVKSCESTIQWNILGVDDVAVTMPPETDLVQRTYIITLVYLGLHAALIVTSLYGLCGVNNSCLGRKSFVVFIAPWAVVWVSIIVLDVLASIYFIIDTISATSVDGIMNLLEVTVTDDVQRNFELLPPHYLYLPPILMLLGSSKLFIFFIANIVCVVFIVKAGWTASTYHKYLDQTRRNYENTMANVNPAFEGLREETMAQKQHERQLGYLNDQSSIHEVASSAATAPPESAEVRYNDTTRVQPLVYPYHVPQQAQKQQLAEEESKYKIQRPTTLAVPERPASQQQQYYRNEPEGKEIDNRLSRYQETNGNVIKTVEPLNDIPEQQQSNTRIRVLPPIDYVNRPQKEVKPQMNRSQSEIKQKPVPPPKPQYNRYSMQPSGNDSPVLYRPDRVNSSKVERNSSSIRAPDELRSQLPWSYFKPREEAPRRAFTHLEEGEETPNVPVPDYTLHYGRRERTKLNDSDGDGSWNHQRY